MRCVDRNVWGLLLMLSVAFGLTACANQFDVDELEFGGGEVANNATNNRPDPPNDTRVCEFSMSPGAGESCMIDVDCQGPLPLTCIAGVCFQACVSNGQCNEGAECVEQDDLFGNNVPDPGSTGLCIEGRALGACESEIDCGFGQTCDFDNQCRTLCFSDEECSSGEVCDPAEERCRTLCSRDGDCRNQGEFCEPF